ncbi:MAG: hypothetical protein ACK4GC_00930 [Paracoccaceae bacterium]
MNRIPFANPVTPETLAARGQYVADRLRHPGVLDVLHTAVTLADLADTGIRDNAMAALAVARARASGAGHDFAVQDKTATEPTGGGQNQ